MNGDTFMSIPHPWDWKIQHSEDVNSNKFTYKFNTIPTKTKIFL